MSRVYRFDGPADLPAHAEPQLLRKRKKGAVAPFYLVAADAYTITDNNGTRPIETYQVVPGQRSVTLTKRESDLIVLSNPGVPPPKALEDLHPWLPKQCYLNDSASSFETMKLTIRRFDRHLVWASEYCDEKWNTICNALRQKKRAGRTVLLGMASSDPGCICSGGASVGPERYIDRFQRHVSGLHAATLPEALGPKVCPS